MADNVTLKDGAGADYVVATKQVGSAHFQKLVDPLPVADAAVLAALGNGPSEYAEDAPHVSGDPASFMLGVRNLALATITDAEGDYSPIAVDDKGRPLTLMGRHYTSVDMTIASGASLSGSVNINSYANIGLIVAGTWTAAVMTFQVSYDNVTFVNLYDDQGVEVSAIVASTRAIANTGVLERLAPFGWAKFRSGTAAAPVNQAQAVTIRVQRKG